VQAAQVEELLNGVLAGLTGVTVLVGDLNSDAEAEPGDPSWTPTYGELTSNGFVDTWEEANPNPNRPGYTCCNDSDLMNLRSSFDQRIDFVLIRTDHELLADRLMGSVKAEVVGEETDDLTDGGLWPSDHGGVFVGMRLEPGLLAQD
jgi:exonuclease III